MTQNGPDSNFDSAAAAYDQRIGRWSRLYIPSLLTAAHVAPGNTVLDIATGTGEVLRFATRAVGPEGMVIGSDISVPMLRVASRRTSGAPLAAMSASSLACADASVNAVTCQLGLMFFPNAEEALAEFHRVLRVDGWMAACVWSSEERAPFISIFPDVISEFVSVPRQTLADGTSLGDETRLRALASTVGFRDVQVTAETREIRFEDFEEYWAPIEAGGSPTATLYAKLPRAVRSEAKEAVRKRMQPYLTDGALVLENEALFVAGRK